MFGSNTSIQHLRTIALTHGLTLTVSAYDREAPTSKESSHGYKHRREEDDDDDEDYKEKADSNRITSRLTPSALQSDRSVQRAFVAALSRSEIAEAGVGTVFRTTGLGDLWDSISTSDESIVSFIPCFDAAPGVSLQDVLDGIRVMASSTTFLNDVEFTVFSTGKSFHAIGGRPIDGVHFKAWTKLLEDSKAVDQKWVEFFEERHDFVLRVSAGEGTRRPVPQREVTYNPIATAKKNSARDLTGVVFP
jgi:hypothetical protein